MGNKQHSPDHEDMVTVAALTILLIVRTSHLCRIVRLPNFSDFAISRRNQKRVAAFLLCLVVVFVYLRMLAVRTDSTAMVHKKGNYETALSASRKHMEYALIDFIIIPIESANALQWLRLAMIIALIVLEIWAMKESLKKKQLDQHEYTERLKLQASLNKKLLDQHEYTERLKLQAQKSREEVESLKKTQLAQHEYTERLKLQAQKSREEVESLQNLSNNYAATINQLQEELASVNETQEDQSVLGHTLASCRSLSDELLEASFVDPEGIFKDHAIDLLRTLAEECDSNSKRRHIGIISGSAASIVGGGLSIAGAALIPVTFGASIGLLAAGATIGFVASGVSFGFNAEKFFKDKKRVRLVQPALEDYIAFNQLFMKAILQIFATVGMTEALETRKELANNETFTYVEAKTATALQNFCQKYKNTERANEKLNCIEEYSGFLMEDLTLLLKKVEEVEHGNAELERWNDDVIAKIKACDLEVLPDVASSANKYIDVDQGKHSFVHFVHNMFRSDDSPDGSDASGKLKQTTIETGLNTLKTGLAAGRAALPVIDIGQDGATIGAQIARVAQGVSAAGIILSSIGVGIDLAFIGHSVYRLVKNEQDSFSKGVLQLANVMEKVNKNLQPQ